MIRRLLCLAFLVSIPAIAAAQQTTGTLQGRVVDEDGKPLIGASILVGGTPLGGQAKAPDGRFLVAGIRAGSYDITIKFLGKANAVRHATISASQLTDLGVIKLGASDVGTRVVTVTAAATPVERERTGTTQTIGRHDLEQSTQTSLVGAINLQGGVSAGGGGISIRGGRTNEVSVRVDGQEIGDRFVGGFGSTNASLYPTVSNLGVEEVQVISSSFGAEYGDFLSGVVNSVTRAGRNDRYEGQFRFRTQVPGLYGSAPALTVTKAGTTTDTTLPAAQLAAGGSKLYEFGFGGPFPGLKELTFYFSGKLNTIEHTSASYHVYDMSQQFADERAAAAKAQWGFALQPTDIGQLPNDNSTVRDLTTKLKYQITPAISLELTGEYGLTTRSFGSLGASYMLDSAAVMVLDANGNVDNAATYNTDPATGRINFSSPKKSTSILEGAAQTIGQNTLINRIGAHVFHTLDDASFYEVTASYVKNKTENGKYDVSKKYGLFDAYDIYPLTASSPNDLALPRYKAYDTTVVLNQYLNSGSPSNIQLRNPITGLYEGEQVSGLSYNPFGAEYSGFGFPAHGNVRSLETRQSNSYNLRGEYDNNFDINDVKAEIKTGFDITSYSLSRSENNLPWATNPFFDAYGVTGAPFDTSLAGGKYLANYLSSPYSPLQGAVYVSTGFDYKSITIRPGVRFDFLAPNAKVPPSVSQRGNDQAVAQYLKTAPNASLKFQVSPRVGVSYPITDLSQFRVSFGMIFKMPEFNELYDAAYTNAGRASQIFGNPDIKPQKVFNYEIGYEAALATDYHLDVNAFYRDVYNEVGLKFVSGVPNTYTIYDVQDFGNVRGLEIALRRNIVNNFGAEINYSLMRAVGTASSPGANYGTLIANVDPYTGERRATALTEFPLDYDRTHTVKGRLSFAWGKGEGPSIGNLKLIENTDIELIGTFQTGTPYTRLNEKGAQIGEYNSERYPSYYTSEAHIERGFRMSDFFGEGAGKLEIAFFADITNLFNSTGAVSVYNTSGSPTTNLTSYNQLIGNFSQQTYFRDISPARSETYAASQYDRFGRRLYNPYGDLNLDGVETPLERYEGYQRLVTVLQSLRGNFQAPRAVSVGVRLTF